MRLVAATKAETHLHRVGPFGGADVREYSLLCGKGSARGGVYRARQMEKQRRDVILILPELSGTGADGANLRPAVSETRVTHESRSRLLFIIE